jgi:hypothetical protein
MNLNVTSAIVWRIAQELCRRPRPEFELSVYLQRLDTGQYPWVSVMRRDTWQSIVDMCLDGNGISVHPLGEPRTLTEEIDWRAPDRGYLLHALDMGINRVVDGIEALVGLPHWRGKRPPTTAPLLSVRVIAEIMQRLLFHSEAIWTEPGCRRDDSGPPTIESWVAEFPEVHTAAADLLRAGDRAGAARKASRVWRLNRAGHEARAMLLDLGTAEARTIAPPQERLSLGRWYAGNGHQIAPLVDWMLTRLIT